MPGKALALVIASISGVVGAGYLLSADNTSRFHWVRSDLTGGQHERAALNRVDPRPGASAQAPAPNPPSDNAVGFMLASVADQYSQNTRYPSWSTPLSPAQAQGYQGNRYQPVTLPLGNDGQFTVTLEKYRFTRGEPILVVASLQGPQVIGNSVQATLEHSQKRESVEKTALASANSPGYYEGELGSDEAPGEYRLLVEALVDGKPVRHVSTLTIEPYLGEFKGVGDTYVTNNNLVIPVQFAPDQAGFYALSAQLYDGDTPIAQLQAEQRLDMAADTISLRAHGTVLANREIEGQLKLRHLQIRQLPAAPGRRTHYAFGPEDGYTFSPPDLRDLQDIPAVDPESEQRAALLRQLADKF